MRDCSTPYIPGSKAVDEATVDAVLPYNRTKRLGELAVWETHRNHGLPITIVRPATIWVRDRQVASQEELIYDPPSLTGLIATMLNTVADFSKIEG